jgi:hypothetical protein
MYFSQTHFVSVLVRLMPLLLSDLILPPRMTDRKGEEIRKHLISGSPDGANSRKRSAFRHKKSSQSRFSFIVDWFTLIFG